MATGGNGRTGGSRVRAPFGRDAAATAGEIGEEEEMGDLTLTGVVGKM